MVEKCRKFIEQERVQSLIASIIVLNAIVLGLQTKSDLSSDMYNLLELLDVLCLSIFVVELIIKMIAYNKRFVFDPWNIFDFVIVAGSIVFMSSSLSIVRAFRIFRILKIITEFDELRILVKAMLKTIPVMFWALVLLLIIFYIFAVFGTTLFSQEFPELFGDLAGTIFTLFQVMTFESWATAVARPVMEVYPYAWIYFLLFILSTSITVLNVMVGIVVDAVSEISAAEKMKAMQEKYKDNTSIEKEIDEIKKHLEVMESLMAAQKARN